MAQVTALRLACEDRGSRLAALHPTSHIFVHEKSNYQLLGHFDALAGRRPPPPVDRRRPGRRFPTGWAPSASRSRCAKSAARRRRGTSWRRSRPTAASAAPTCTWMAPACGRPPPATTARRRRSRPASIRSTSRCTRASAALAARCSPAARDFIARAAEWFRRQGGNVIHRSPYVVSAAMQFDQRLADDAAVLPPHRTPVRHAARLPADQGEPGPPAGEHAAPAPAGVARARAGDPQRHRARAQGLAVRPRRRTARCRTPASSSCTSATT